MKQILEKIVGWLNRIPADKYKHFAVGAAIASVILAVTLPFIPEWLALADSVIAVVLAAVGK